MPKRLSSLLAFALVVVAMVAAHFPFLRLPYFWDEAGYYVPAALDFSRCWQLIPTHTLPVGHTPLVMIYLGLVWRLLGDAPFVTRVAMSLVAAATLVTLYVVARRLVDRETAFWSALLLALSPMFFAQSTLVHLDLPVALFTMLAVLFLLRDQWWLFALAALAAVLTKETAVVILPVAWLYSLRRGAEQVTHGKKWLHTAAALALPVMGLAAWAFYYRSMTGYWTGNRGYLAYNLYTTLSPARAFWSLLRRAYELFFSGFNWLLAGAAVAGIWWGRRHSFHALQSSKWRSLRFLAGGLIIVYLLLLSIVGGAILPRYLLPVIPLFYLVAATFVSHLPRLLARLALGATAACFVWAWFINPPCPFPYEDNLSYAHFIRLHQQAANYLESQPGQPRILTAWPASDELTHPYLGYVSRALEVVPIDGFAPDDIVNVRPESFDLLYLYSRKWEPPGNWMTRFPAWLRLQERYFDYRPQASFEDFAARYRLHLLAEFESAGQWVRIYRR